MSIRLTVQLSVQDGKGQEFEAHMGRSISRVKAEDAGCEMYDLYRSVVNDTQYALLESWTTQADLDAHAQANTKRASGGGTGEFLAGPAVLHRYED